MTIHPTTLGEATIHKTRPATKPTACGQRRSHSRQNAVWKYNQASPPNTPSAAMTASETPMYAGSHARWATDSELASPLSEQCNIGPWPDLRYQPATKSNSSRRTDEPTGSPAVGGLHSPPSRRLNRSRWRASNRWWQTSTSPGAATSKCARSSTVASVSILACNCCLNVTSVCRSQGFMGTAEDSIVHNVRSTGMSANLGPSI